MVTSLLFCLECADGAITGEVGDLGIMASVISESISASLI